MDKDKDSIYTFEISGEEESRAMPIPRRKIPVDDQYEDNGDESSSQEPFNMNVSAGFAGKNHRQVMQGLGSKRAEHLKKLYDSITNMNKGKVTTSFTKQGRELAGIDESDADFVPFQCYWPTYETMSEAQTKWFIHWRGRVRAGEYPDTDLSYIFLYIYEIINSIGVSSAKEGFSILCRLWSSYRERHPSMDRYMVPWLQDYISVYKCGDMSEIFGLIPDISLMSLFPDYMVLKFIGMADVELPVEFINRFSDYKFYLSKFFKSDEDNLLLKFIPLVFKQIDAHFVNKTGKCIFEMFRPEVIPWQSRLPFTNAVYYGDIKTIPIERFSYTEHRPLRDFFTAVIKHTENVLRGKKGFKGRLRGYELDKDILKAIDDFIDSEFRKEEAARNYVKIEVDREKILQLIYDSEIVKQRLLEGADQDGEAQTAFKEGNDEQDGRNIQCVLPHVDNQINAAAAGNADAYNPDGMAADGKLSLNTGISSEDGSFEGFISSLGEKEIELVKFLSARGFMVDEPELEKAFAGEFLQNIIDNINTVAVDIIGDILIVCEDGSWFVCDDYQEDMAKAKAFENV